MKGKTAFEILNYLIGVIVYYLEDLSKFEYSEFISGERMAYVECLEIVQMWEHAQNSGLDFDIESRFPIK